MKINLHNSTKSPKVSTTISINDWLSKIKYGDQHLPIINKARELERGIDEYDNIKKESLPVVTFNYQFKKYLKLDNAVASTGVFYVDVDANNIEESIQIKNELQQNKHIYACWISLSGKGVGALVRSSVITPESFKQVNKLFCEQHQISFDKFAVKLTQYNVLSHDPELYLNPDSIEFNPVIVPKKIITKKVSSLANQKKKKHIGTDDTFLRYNNLNDYWIEGDVVTNREGFDAVELYLPVNIQQGKRKFTLLAFTNNLVWLNPQAKPSQVIGLLRSKNKLRCDIPLEDGELQDIINSVFRYKEEGTLQPLAVKKRKIIFGPGNGMDKEEKRLFTNQTIGAWKREKTQEEIYQVIEDWNFSKSGKITTKKVSKKSKKSLITVKRYWSEYKEYVKELNESFKQPINNNIMKKKKKEISVMNQPEIKEPAIVKEVRTKIKEMEYNDSIVYLVNLQHEYRMAA